MSTPKLWETKVPTSIKELCKNAGLQPYYSGQEQSILRFAKLIIMECSRINNEEVGRRIGEIDLDILYKDHFKIKY
jgi:hypothetical protein